MAHINFTASGCDITDRYGGHDVDSYRTELVEVIGSIGRPGPVHFALENYSAYSDAMAIITKPVKEFVTKKPWPIVKHGDLKQLVHDISHHRGRSSVLGSRVRGHLAEKDVQELEGDTRTNGGEQTFG